MLKKETIEEFRKIYKQKTGKKLSDKEALEIVTNLLLVFGVIYHPIPAKEKRNKQKKNKEPKGNLMQYLILSDIMYLKV